MTTNKQNIEYHRQQRNKFTRSALQVYDNKHNCRDSRELVQLYISYAKRHHELMKALKDTPPMFNRNEQDHCPHCGQYWEYHREYVIPASATEPSEQIIECEFVARHGFDADGLRTENEWWQRKQNWAEYERYYID